jgi:hypothetical protein
MIQVVGNTINDIIYGTVQTETRRRTAVFAAAWFFTRTIAEFGHDTGVCVCVCVCVCDADRQLLGRLRSRHAQAMPSLRGFHAHLGE